MENITIQLINATIGYKTRSKTTVVAADINGAFCEGELVSLIGRNGCGKSTLLRTIAGFQELLGGKVMQDGREIQDYTIQERARMLSIVTTHVNAVDSMSVFDLVAMGRSPYTGFWGKLTDADREIVAESIRMVGMEELSERMVVTLSDGERQKAMIAKAIAQETSVIVLDEPTSFLDYPSKVKTMQLLSELAHNSKKTIIISTHDLEQALQFSDRIWLVDENKQIIADTPSQMVAEGVLRRCLGYVGR